MPLVSFAGTNIRDLEAVIATIEAYDNNVKQVVGNYGERWYVLVEQNKERSSAPTGEVETR